MSAERQRLGEVLLAHKLLTPEQLEEAVRIQREQPAPLGSILLRLGFVSEDQLLRSLAAQLGVAPWNLEKYPPKPNARGLVPPDLCEKYRMIPVQLRGDLLTLAMRNPQDMEAVDLVRDLTGLRVEPVLASDEQLLAAISSGPLEVRHNASIDALVEDAVREFGHKHAEHQRAMLVEEDQGPVIDLVNQILSDAIRAGASDVHLEPMASCMEVRYRIDGEMMPVRRLPKDLITLLATRIKILAELDIVESRLPQDGRVNARIDGRNVDLRISVLPNYHGGRIVMRILDQGVSLRMLEEVGLVSPNYERFLELIHRPYGLFLVTGPTGSGKTTTLYAALSELKRQTRNIMTCEDPVEYDVEGLSQTQINEKVGLTFPVALRSILRQDPDAILVGEIRDLETARTAIHAAMTGHLVLSTLHCNDAISAVPRMADLGVDPYLVGTCLIGVSSQRLLRQLCPKCRKEVADPRRLVRAAGAAPGEAPKLYDPAGCAACFESGFRGRYAVHELLTVSPAISRAISERAPVESIRKLAFEAGYVPMQVDAMRAVHAGRTTLEEARRQVYFGADVDLSSLPKAA